MSRADRARVVSTRDLNRSTLARQGLLERHRGEVPEVIGRLAGLQAQHADWPYIALWSRLADFHIEELVRALDDRSVVKATLMRSTLHLVAADDYPAFDAATRVRRTEVWAPIVRRAGIDDVALHERFLASATEPRTVGELEAFADSAGREGSSLADHAPGGVSRVAYRVVSARGGLVHVPPSGHWRTHGKARYIAARTWLPGLSLPHAEVALDESLVRYLRAYGPASLADFGQWFGERITRTRAAAARLGDHLVHLQSEDGRDLVDLVDLTGRAGLAPTDDDGPVPVRFLARWDSLLVAYDQRARIVPDPVRPAVYRKNADVLPTFLVDGFVAGTWSSAVSRGTATLTLTPVGRLRRPDRQALEAEGDRLIRFIEPDAGGHEVAWAPPD